MISEVITVTDSHTDQCLLLMQATAMPGQVNQALQQKAAAAASALAMLRSLVARPPPPEEKKKPTKPDASAPAFRRVEVVEPPRGPVAAKPPVETLWEDAAPKVEAKVPEAAAPAAAVAVSDDDKVDVGGKGGEETGEGGRGVSGGVGMEMAGPPTTTPAVAEEEAKVDEEVMVSDPAGEESVLEKEVVMAGAAGQADEMIKAMKMD
jgi:hypothetical protein